MHTMLLSVPGSCQGGVHEHSSSLFRERGQSLTKTSHGAGRGAEFRASLAFPSSWGAADRAALPLVAPGATLSDRDGVTGAP